MQIVSEIAEIVASAIDCVLVLWFLTSHFGKKKTIEWWKYAVWFEFYLFQVILWEKCLIYKVL